MCTEHAKEIQSGGKKALGVGRDTGVRLVRCVLRFV